MVSLILNTAAESAKKNVRLSSLSVNSSVGKLSSGNRITSPEQDVAGLSIGTSLKNNVSTMRAALSNSSQATTMLGVADGALDNIGQILQRQKALATQATSGSLDATALSFMNQEFQNLTLEIDRISSSSNFNGINLIDGSLSGVSNITSNIGNANLTGKYGVSTAVSSTLNFEAAIPSGEIIQFFSSDATAPAGLSRSLSDGSFIATPFTSVATGSGSSEPSSLLEFDGTVSASTATTNFLSMVENLKKYTGDDETTLRAREIVSSFDIEKSSSTELKITAKSSGSYWNMIDILTPATPGVVSVNNISNTASQSVLFTTNGTAGTDGALSAGGFSISSAGTPGNTAYSNDFNYPGLVPSVYAQGIVSGSILSSLTPTSSWTTGINLSGISNNPDFIGKIPQMSATYNADNSVNMSVTIGKAVYQANSVDTNVDSNSNIRFYSPEGSGYGSFSLQLAANGGMEVSSQNDANIFASRVNGALNGIDVYQRRQLTNYNGDAIGFVLPTGSTSASGDLSGSSFYMITDDFTNINVEKIVVSAPASSTADASITLTINGEEYVSGYQYDGTSISLSNLQVANTFSSNDSATTNHDGKYGFVNLKNPNKMLVLDYNASTNLSITSAAEASGLQSALNKAFGLGSSATNGGISFQVGTKSSDVIDVKISSTSTKDIYKDSNNIPTVLSIATKEQATAAGTIIDAAIQKVTSIRAQVGASLSRFEYASANINSSIENLDAARGLFLDTDISSESTNLAQAQIRLQASISVLAQANQLTQSYLKLL